MILDISFNRGMKAIIKLCKESSLLNVNLICVGLAMHIEGENKFNLSVINKPQ